MLNLFSSHLISSHRSFSWKLLIASHCHRSLCHPISSQLISSHVFSSFFHLISSHPMSCLLSLPQLFSADHNCSHLFSCHLSFSHLFSSHLSLSQLFSNFSQFFSTLLSSPQLVSAHLMSSHLFSPLLTSSKLFSHLLSWSQLLSARLTSSQLFSAQSQIISALLWPKTCSKQRTSVPKQATPMLSTEKTWRSEPLHTASFCTEKLVHAEAFYTELGKLLFTASFYTKQAFVHSKLLPRKYFTHGSFYTEASTQRSFYT